MYGTAYVHYHQVATTCDTNCGYLNNTLALHVSQDLVNWILISSNIAPEVTKDHGYINYWMSTVADDRLTKTCLMELYLTPTIFRRKRQLFGQVYILCMLCWPITALFYKRIRCKLHIMQCMKIMLMWQISVIIFVSYATAQQSTNGSNINNITNFIPFGSAYGDKALERELNFVTGPILIKVRFPFFNQWYDEIKLYNHGLILFGNISYNLPHSPPGPFPLRDFICAAPYWADTDITRDLESNIFYREVEDAETLTNITNMVRDGFPQFTTPRMLWAFVATWYQVPGHMNEPGRNTYQAIITTNGIYSFTMFTYHQLQWSAGLWGGYPQIGFNAGDQVNFFTLNQSFTADVLQVVNNSNIGVRGQFVFHTTGNISDVECNSQAGLQAMPFRGSMYGGYEFRLSGICFNESSYTVKVNGQEIRDCQITLSHILCTMPMTYGGRLTITVHNGNDYIATTDFLASEPEHNADLILRNYDEVNNAVQSIDERQFVLRFHSNDITNNYRFKIIIYAYGAQQFIENGTIHNRTMNRIDLGLGAMNLSSLQNLTIGYNSIFSVTDQPTDRAYSLTIFFEVDRPSTRLYLGAIPLYAVGIFAVFAVTYNAYCPIWYEFQPNPQTYIDQIPPCPCRVLTTWSENQMGYAADKACDGRKPAGETCIFHQGATGCYRRTATTGKAGAQCCYDAQGLWISDPNKGAGTLDAYSPDNSAIYHFFYDVLPYFSCCKPLISPSAEKCKQYMDKRPPGRCENLLPVPIGGNGDPHFMTLSGSSYTFNGYGEYTLIRSTVAQLEVQVRLAPITVNSSNPSEDRATAIAAFVIKNGNQSRVQFELFPLQKLLQISVDNRAVEYTLLTEEDFKFLSASQTIYSDDHQLKIQQTSGTSFEITYGESNMQFIVYVRPSYDLLDLMSIIPRDTMEKGKPQGLMGDFDGLAFPNGTRVSSATMKDDRALFSYGEAWRTTDATSLFYYYYQSSHGTHQNSSYRPTFSQELFEKYNGSARFRMALDTCRSLNGSQRCLYDVLITNDSTISNMHKQFDTNVGTWDNYKQQVEQDIANSMSSASKKTNANSSTSFLIGLAWLLMMMIAFN